MKPYPQEKEAGPAAQGWLRIKNTGRRKLTLEAGVIGFHHLPCVLTAGQSVDIFLAGDDERLPEMQCGPGSAIVSAQRIAVYENGVEIYELSD